MRGLVLALGLASAAALTAGAAADAPRSLCDVAHPSDAAVTWVCRPLRRGETLERLFGDRWVDVARFNRVDQRHAVAGVAIKVPVNLDDVRDFTPLPPVYAPAAGEAKFLLADLSEQFLGAYAHGRLIFSSPLAVGRKACPTPVGEFRITAAHRHHPSSLYTIEGTTTPYPMTWALRFHVTSTVSWWLHGRDVPGYPVSHGCLGLYDEPMQQAHYGEPATPVLEDARRLYEWVVGASDDAPRPRPVAGPRLRIIGEAP
jgi:hypothetical protein